MVLGAILMSDPTTPLPGGFEPPIFRLTVGCLNQLGHRSFYRAVFVRPRHAWVAKAATLY